MKNADFSVFFVLYDELMFIVNKKVGTESFYENLLILYILRLNFQFVNKQNVMERFFSKAILCKR